MNTDHPLEVCICVCIYIYIFYKYKLENATGIARTLIIDFVDSSNDYPKF
jgi:hypothetical protein